MQIHFLLHSLLYTRSVTRYLKLFLFETNNYYKSKQNSMKSIPIMGTRNPIKFEAFERINIIDEKSKANRKLFPPFMSLF